MKKRKSHLAEVLLFITLVLIILRGVGVFTFSWWWVFIPLWGPIGLSLATLILAGILVFFRVVVNTLYAQVISEISKNKNEEKK